MKIVYGRENIEEERDKRLLSLSLYLHEVLFYQFIRQQSCDDEVDIEHFINELEDIKTRLSSLMDHYWRYGRSFVKPIAKLRSKVNSYIVYLKQMRNK